MSRRIGRILAFQALYSWEVGGIDIDELLDFSWIDRDIKEDDASKESDYEEQVISEDEKPVPENKVKYFLNDAQFKTFENFSPEKKEEIFTFARLLAKGTVENISEIDKIIQNHLSEKWRLDRIDKVALCVMRLAIYEMLFQKQTPATIVIDEAVEIVKSYGSDDSHRFTNAVLDRISKEFVE